MGGIYGFASTEGFADPSQRLYSMRDALPIVTDTWCWEGLKSEQRIGLGVLQPTWKGARGHYASRGAGPAAVFDGVLFEAGSTAAIPDGADRLLDAYLREGSDCFARFNGSFNVAIWDPGPHRLILANDRIGQRPLYYTHAGTHLAFGSYLAQVMAADVVRPEMAVGGLLDLIYYGFVTGESTLFEGVRLLPPGSALVCEQGRVSIATYWRCDSVEPHGRLDEERVAGLAEVLKRAVTRFFNASPDTGLCLTGGIDSRALLAAAVSSDLAFVAHSGGREQSTDVVVARELAAQCRIPHVFEPVGPEHVSEWLYPMVRYQGGGVATLHSHPCHTFDYPLPFSAMIQGIGGEFARGADWIAEPLRPADKTFTGDDLRSKIERRGTDLLRRRGLWNPASRGAADAAEMAHIDALLNKYQPKDHPRSVLKLMSLYDLGRHELNKAVVIARAKREVWCPFFDHEWVEAVASVPLEERVRRDLLVEIIRHLEPRFMKSAYSRTLLPLNASALRVRMTKQIRRLTCRAAHITGWPIHRAEVPTTDYPNWIRREMRGTILQLLEAPDAAYRQFLDGAVVRQAVDEHFSTGGNWEGLIAALAVFEMSHKLWVEKDPDARGRSGAGWDSTGRIFRLAEQAEAQALPARVG